MKGGKGDLEIKMLVLVGAACGAPNQDQPGKKVTKILFVSKLTFYGMNANTFLHLSCGAWNTTAMRGDNRRYKGVVQS